MADPTRGELDVEGRPVSWVLDGTGAGRPLVILAHGAGAPYTSPFMVAVAAALAARAIAVLRFHFPYMEAVVRGGKRRPPNSATLLLQTWRAMLEQAHAREPERAVILAGKSMGGRMASMLLAAEGRTYAADRQVRGAVYLGYPLHPPGKPDRLRADHLGDVPVPQLFISGTRDNLCRLDLLEPVLREIGSGAELHVVEGGDHSLARRRREPVAGSEDWLEVMAAFIRNHGG